MPVESVGDLDDPRLADYRHLPDPELLRRGEVFVAEGRLVVRTLLTRSPFRARSVLVTRTAYAALADVLAPRLPDLAVHLVPDGAIERLTGFDIHRGCLAIGERPGPASVATLLASLPDARRLVVLDRVGNADNVGGVFRSASALGADGVVLGPGCCDPLYRKAIRVSMGAALLVPFCHATDWTSDLDSIRSAGFTLAALTPSESARDIGSFADSLPAGARVAVLAGSEGAGLAPDLAGRADFPVGIRMAPGADSLNVATAVAIALHRLFDARGPASRSASG